MKHAGTIQPETLSVALIGPDAERRSAVARALAETRRAAVREFDSYPPGLDHLQSLLASFDVIILDLDSDPDVALELVEKASSRRRGGDHGLFGKSRSETCDPPDACRRS